MEPHRMVCTRTSHSDNAMERLRTTERGLAVIYQMLQRRERPSSGGNGGRCDRHLSYQRSASQILSPNPSSSPSFLEAHRADNSPFMKRVDPSMWINISIQDLQDAVMAVMQERDKLTDDVHELEQVVEVARRERVLAIDERDKLLHSLHLIKMSQERCEATVKLLEAEKGRLAKRCDELEQEVASLQKAHDLAQKTRHTALEERTKLIDERNQLKAELTKLQADRDFLFESKLSVEGSLQECLSQRQQLIADCERNRNTSRHLQLVAKSLQQQNEILNNRMCEVVSVVVKRDSASHPWGFSIDGGCGSEFFSGDTSIVVTGVAPNSPAASCLRFGDRLMAVNERSMVEATLQEATDLLSQLGQDLTLSLTLRRPCSQQPLMVRVYVPAEKHSYKFSYEPHYVVTRMEPGSRAADVLRVGDRIVQVQGHAVVGMRGSQMRKMIRSYRSGLVLDIQRLPTEFLPQTVPPTASSSVENGPPQKSTVSEHSVGYCSLPTLPHALTPATSNNSFTVSKQAISHQSTSATTTPSNVRHLSLTTSAEQIAVSQESGKQLSSSLSSSLLWTNNKLSFPATPTYSVRSLNALSPKQTSV